MLVPKETLSYDMSIDLIFEGTYYWLSFIIVSSNSITSYQNGDKTHGVGFGSNPSSHLRSPNISNLQCIFYNNND